MFLSIREEMNHKDVEYFDPALTKSVFGLDFSSAGLNTEDMKDAAST